MRKIKGFMAVNRPKTNSIIPITDCKESACPFFQCYGTMRGEIFRTNCNFPESIELGKEISLDAIDPDVT